MDRVAQHRAISLAFENLESPTSEEARQLHERLRVLWASMAPEERTKVLKPPSQEEYVYLYKTLLSATDGVETQEECSAWKEKLDAIWENISPAERLVIELEAYARDGGYFCNLSLCKFLAEHGFPEALGGYDGEF